MNQKQSFQIDGQSREYSLQRPDQDEMVITLGDREYAAKVVERDGDRIVLHVNDSKYEMSVAPADGGAFDVSLGSVTRKISGIRIAASKRPRAKQTASASSASSTVEGGVVAPMPGKVMDVHVARGDSVSSGQALVTLEAMKMENKIESPIDGVVEDIPVASGDSVGKGDVLAIVKPA